MVEAIGIDIGGTNLRAARVDAEGRILEVAAERIVRDPQVVLGRIFDLVTALESPAVAGIGIGIPGRVDSLGGKVLSGGYVDLSGVALAERLAERTGRPVVLDGDCNMALVAEMRTGAARGCRNVTMLTIGTGIGGAVAVDGAILRGRMSAGQLGHLTVEDDGLPCNCGRRGCVETTSSGTALGRLIAEAGLPAGTRVEGLIEGMRAGRDDAGTAVLRRWALPLRSAIDSLVATLDPELVLLGGGLGHAAVAALELAPALSPWYRCPVAAAALDDDAGVIGAALALLDRRGPRG